MRNGFSGFSIACHAGRLEVIQALAPDPRICPGEKVSSTAFTPLDNACRGGHVQVVAFLRTLLAGGRTLRASELTVAVVLVPDSHPGWRDCLTRCHDHRSAAWPQGCGAVRLFTQLAVVVCGRVWTRCYLGLRGCLRAAELLTCACVATLLFGPSPCAPQVCRQVWRRVVGHSVAVAQAHLGVHAASRSERRGARGLRGVPRRDRGLCALGDDVAPAVQRLVAAPAAQPGAAHPWRGPPQVTHKSRGRRSPVFRCVAGHTAAAPAAAPACTWRPVCQLMCPQPRTSGCGWEWEWEWEWEC